MEKQNLRTKLNYKWLNGEQVWILLKLIIQQNNAYRNCAGRVPLDD